MYRIYFTDPSTLLVDHRDVSSLNTGLKVCEDLRTFGYIMISMVSDYQNMVGKAGAKGAGKEYVPQLKN